MYQQTQGLPKLPDPDAESFIFVASLPFPLHTPQISSSRPELSTLSHPSGYMVKIIHI